MNYKEKRAMTIKIMEVIDEWGEEYGLETSPHMDIELAERIFNKLFENEKT